MQNDTEIIISGYNISGILILYAKQVITTNRLSEDLQTAQRIIAEQQEKIRQLEELRNG
jgi:hypothetical protein